MKSEDPTRLTTAAMMHHKVAGISEGVLDNRVNRMSLYNKPLVMSEFGAGALAGLNGNAMPRWTEEFQENMFRHQVGRLRTIPFLQGTSPWVLVDFRSPRRELPNVQDFFNRKGLLSERGDRKEAFFVEQELYRAKAQQCAGG